MKLKALFAKNSSFPVSITYYSLAITIGKKQRQYNGICCVELASRMGRDLFGIYWVPGRVQVRADTIP